MNPNPLHTPDGGDDIDALAGEYVLGTLSAARRREVESRMPHEPALRDAVDAWDARLHPLTALAAPVEPSPALWTRIERSVAPPFNAAAANVKRAATGVQTWWNNLNLWRGLAGTGFAAAAILAGVLVVRVQAPATPQYMVVLVAPQDKAPGWVIQTGSGRQEQLSLIPLGTVAVPSDKSLQFWTKADAWRGPVSLGLVQPGRALRVPIEKLPPLEANQLFELTLEPANGSPIDRPTGPIQFIGRAVKVL
ncbi:MAG: anti-sigma factor [Pseudomonadota bacterium]